MSSKRVYTAIEGAMVSPLPQFIVAADNEAFFSCCHRTNKLMERKEKEDKEKRKGEKKKGKRRENLLKRSLKPLFYWDPHMRVPRTLFHLK